MDLDPRGNIRFYANGATKSDITARVDTGTLGGLREARDTDLEKTIDSLDSYAFDVANAYNAVHSAGYGLDGGTGRNLFSISSTQAGAAATIAIDPSIDGPPERIAASSTSADLPGGNGAILQLANLSDTQAFGGATLTDRFASMATDIGFRKQDADNEVQLRSDTLSTAESLSDSANGVSLDEEMVNLTQYQRAFQASSKVMQTADQLLQTLMDSF
jgi:flagellar hook-associated protein 1 FlgK